MILSDWYMGMVTKTRGRGYSGVRFQDMRTNALPLSIEEEPKGTLRCLTSHDCDFSRRCGYVENGLGGVRRDANTASRMRKCSSVLSRTTNSVLSATWSPIPFLHCLHRFIQWPPCIVPKSERRMPYPSHLAWRFEVSTQCELFRIQNIRHSPIVDLSLGMTSCIFCCLIHPPL